MRLMSTTPGQRYGVCRTMLVEKVQSRRESESFIKVRKRYKSDQKRCSIDFFSIVFARIPINVYFLCIMFGFSRVENRLPQYFSLGRHSPATEAR